MSNEQPNGELQVELDASEIQHLLKRGTSDVVKEVGPIAVRIRCQGRVYPTFVMKNGSGEPIDPEVFSDE